MFEKAIEDEIVGDEKMKDKFEVSY